MSFLCRNGASSNNHRRLRQKSIAGTLAGTTALGVVLSFEASLAQDVPASTLAQDVPPSARQITLDVNPRLEWSDNPDLLLDEADRFTSRTGLRLSYARRTGTDEFEIFAGGDLELRDDGDNDIDTPSLGVSWFRDIETSNIGLSFDISEIDLGTTTGLFFDEDTESVDFGTIDRGTRRTASLALFGAFGIDQPFGGTYRFEQQRISYSDTTSADLQDADRRVLEGSLYFALDPRIVLGLTARQIDFDEEEVPGERDVLDTRLGTYLETEITQTLSGRFDLGWQEVEETGFVTDTDDGLFFGVELTQEMGRSELTLDANSEVTRNGQRDELRVGQSIELPRGGFDYSLGVTKTEGFDAEPLLGFSWFRELPRGTFRLALEQRAVTGRDDENLINSRLSMTYAQQLTTRSSFDVSFAFVDRNEQAETGTDRRRLDLDLTYRYELTQDWDLATGISLIRQTESDTPDIDANTVFIGLERQFVWN